jgi:hypothetical protein
VAALTTSSPTREPRGPIALGGAVGATRDVGAAVVLGAAGNVARRGTAAPMPELRCEYQSPIGIPARVIVRISSGNRVCSNNSDP